MTHTVTTITGQEIRVTPNNSSRTFTLRTNGSKYRTFKMDKDDFRSAKHWTGNDWKEFLKTDEYSRVK